MIGEWLTPCRYAGERVAHLRDVAIAGRKGKGQPERLLTVDVVKELPPGTVLGVNVCGRELNAEDLWVPSLPTDTKCPDCLAGFTACEQETLL